MSWLDDLPRCPVPGPNRGKFCHPDRASALRQLASLVARGKPVGPRFGPYEHKACGSWHVGHDGHQLTRDIRRALKAGTTATRTANRRKRRR